MLWMSLVKKWNWFGRGKYFNKSEKTERSNCLPNKDEDIFCSFYNDLGISSQVTPLEVSIVKILADQDRKATTLYPQA